MIPKFRAWDKDSKVMRPWKNLILEKDDGDDFWLIGYKENACITSFDHKQILMQSTGLKDKNGVEIFVGDIVILTSKSINYADTYWHNYAEVFQQSNGAYRLRVRGKGIYETELYGNRKQVTLNGNIYETPELLENERFCTETDDPDY